MEINYIKLKDIKPALSGCISESLMLLKRSPSPDDEAIHDIRVLMKKLRATMKLVASQLDAEAFNREYNAFREAGRILSAWRDSSVHRKTLKSIKKINRNLFLQIADHQKVKELLARPELSSDIPAEITERIVKIEDLLKKASFRMRFYTLDKLDPQLLLKELDKSYKIVSEVYLECRNNPKPVRLHEFRKKAKDFLYQLYFFRPLNPSAIKGLERRLDNLTQNLGKFNDLTQLINAVEYNFGDPANTAALNELMIIIKGKQDQYLEKVWPSAYKVFCPGQQLINVLGFKLLVI